MNPVRTARRIARGTRSPAAIRGSTKLPASRSSSDNREPLGELCALVRDYVVDRVVDHVSRRPTGSGLEALRHRLAVRDLLEARLVGLLEWHVADLRRRSGPFDHTLGELLDRDLLRGADV